MRAPELIKDEGSMEHRRAYCLEQCLPLYGLVLHWRNIGSWQNARDRPKQVGEDAYRTPVTVRIVPDL